MSAAMDSALLLFNFRKDTDSVNVEDIVLQTVLRSQEARTVYVRLREGEATQQSNALQIQVLLAAQVPDLVQYLQPREICRGHAVALLLPVQVTWTGDREAPSNIPTGILQGCLDANEKALELAKSATRQHRRRLQAAQEKLQAMLQQMRQPQEQGGLLTVTQQPTFLISVLEYLDQKSTITMPSVVEWLTQRPAADVQLRSGMRADAHGACIVILKQLQQKVQMTIKEGKAQNPQHMMVRTVRHSRRNAAPVKRLLPASQEDHGLAKYQCVWVCPMLKLSELVQSLCGGDDAGRLYEAGSIHVVTGLSAVRTDQIYLEPCLATCGDGDAVAVVGLEDIHEYIHLYHAIVAAVHTKVPPSALSLTCLDSLLQAAENCDCFSAWLSLNFPSHYLEADCWNQLLGEDRHAFFQESAKALGLNHFSSAQQHTLQEISGAVTVISTFAGGGKTTLLLAVAWYVSHHSKEMPNRPLMWCLAPNQKVCRQLRDRLQSLGLAVAGIGFDKDEEIDLHEAFLEGVAQTKFLEWNDFYEPLDKELDRLATLWQQSQSSLQLLELACKLLAVRHTHLQQWLYKKIAESQKLAQKNLDVVVCTTSMYTKLAGGKAWKEMAERPNIILMDEYMSEPAERMALTMLTCKAALLVGRVGCDCSHTRECSKHWVAVMVSRFGLPHVFSLL